MFEFTFSIPYEHRNSYISVLKKINSLVSLDGMFSVFVNNNPYSLECHLCVITSENKDEIMAIINENSLQIQRHLSYDDMTASAILAQAYNLLACPPHDDLLEEKFHSLFLFPDKAELEKKGFFSHTSHKEKVFISYCHKNSDIVDDFVLKMKEKGLNYWIDKEDISAGDLMMDNINQGIQECDLYIIFISRHTKSSNYAKYELSNSLANLVNKKKKWFLIRLDDVNPNEITPNLGNYLYEQYSKEKVDIIIDKIKSKLKRR